MENAMAYISQTGTTTDTDLVRGCFSPDGSVQFEASFPIYKICAEMFPNVLGVRLLQFYLNSTDRDLMNKALQLLSFSLSISTLSAFALADLKSLLLESFTKHSHVDKVEGEADLPFLRQIASSVTRFLHQNNETWLDLSHCLCDLANSEPLLGFYIFLDLPTSLDWNFLVHFYREFEQEAMKTVTMPEHCGSEEIVAAFGTLVYIGVQLNQPHINRDCTPLLAAIGDAARTLLEDTVYHSIKEVGRLLQRNIHFYNFLPGQKNFVFQVAYQLIQTRLSVETQVAVLKMLEHL